VNPEIGVETNQLPEFGSNPTPDPSTQPKPQANNGGSSKTAISC